jgi:hypothetical protein
MRPLSSTTRSTGGNGQPTAGALDEGGRCGMDERQDHAQWQRGHAVAPDDTGLGYLRWRGGGGFGPR